MNIFFNINLSLRTCKYNDPIPYFKGLASYGHSLLSAPDGPHVGPMNLAIRGVHSHAIRAHVLRMHYFRAWDAMRACVHILHMRCDGMRRRASKGGLWVSGTVPSIFCDERCHYPEFCLINNRPDMLSEFFLEKKSNVLNPISLSCIARCRQRSN